MRTSTVSVVVPVRDEEENLEPLVRDIVAVLRPLEASFELIVVDDGSQDASWETLRGLAASTPELVAVRLRRNFGQALALQAGFDRARGEVIVTLDGDRQNDPADIPRLLERVEAGADVVSGWRRERQDALLLRRLPSWIANRMIRAVTGVPIRDQGCSLKAYRREVIESLDLYSDMHRFLGVLTLPLAPSIEEIEVRHHPRRRGASKYGLSRVLKVIADLFTIQMLTGFRESPLRWFSLLGSPFLAGALGAAGAALLLPGGSLVLMLTAFVLATAFASCLLYGLLGEAIVGTAERRGPGRTLVRESGEIP